MKLPLIGLIFFKTLLWSQMTLGQYARAPGLPNVLPVHTTECAKEGEECKVPENAEILLYYGDKTNIAKFVVLSGKGNVLCTSAALGVSDPAPDKAKTCHIVPVLTTVPADHVQCNTATEENCNLTGQWSMYFGHKKFIQVKGNGPFPCRNDVIPRNYRLPPLENPPPSLPPVFKCYVKYDGPPVVAQVPPEFKPYAVQGRRCVPKPENWQGFIGSYGAYVPIGGGRGGFLCDPSHLRVLDTAPGYPKFCYVHKDNLPTPPAHPAVGTVVKEVPCGFGWCAAENRFCKALGPWKGFYGSGTNFVSIEGQAGSTLCNAATLKVKDPGGANKLCYISLENMVMPPALKLVTEIPSELEACATDGQKCEATGDWKGFYGSHGKFTAIEGTGPFWCDPHQLTIKDPNPGVRKFCFLEQKSFPTLAPLNFVSAVPEGFVECAKEGGRCNASGPWNGYIGANGKFVEVSGTGYTNCASGALKLPRDPVPGVIKTCYANKLNLNVPIGCFADGNPRDLGGYQESATSMNSFLCKKICKEKGFKFAGTQASSWCFCGNEHGKYGKSTKCNGSCVGAGNQNEICGGQMANSVYQVDP